VVQNVGSCAAIAEVFDTGLPLIERIVTVTGRGVKTPSNLVVPVGTKVGELIEACGGHTEDAHEIVFGGPMMGAPQANLDVPILKGVTGVIVLSRDETKRKETYNCIRCGHCLDACPVFLNPQLLGQMAMAGQYVETEEHHIWDCMLCGCCSYVCPSNIPLSQLFQVTRTAIRRLQAKTAAA
jgi:electron transport complex protein RnfC